MQLEKTINGHNGQLYDSTWRHKGQRFICYSKQVGNMVPMSRHTVGLVCVSVLIPARDQDIYIYIIIYTKYVDDISL